MKADQYPLETVAETLTKMAAAGLITPAELKHGMIPDFDKKAGEKCKHQSFAKGCGIYNKRPFGCRFWNCVWLANHENRAADLHRPDRAGYVIDIMPDFVTADAHDGRPPTNIEVVQIWIDPKRPDAWRSDKALVEYLEREGREGKLALLRFNSSDAITRFPASMCSDNQPHEMAGRAERLTRTGKERFEGIAESRRVRLEAS